MTRDEKKTLRGFLVELLVYAALMAVYYLLVLHLLGGWLYHMFTHERRLYAGVTLGLIIGQGFLLEILTRLLLGWLKGRGDNA